MTLKSNIDDIQRKAQVSTGELEKAIETGAVKAGNKARADIRRGLTRQLGGTTAAARLRGQRGRVWVGANPVPLDRLLNAGIATQLSSGQFILRPGVYNRKGLRGSFVLNKALILERRAGSIVRPDIDIYGLVEDLVRQAEDTAEPILLDEVRKALEAQLGL